MSSSFSRHGDNVITLREYEQTETSLIRPDQADILREKFGTFLKISRAWGGGFRLKASSHVGVIVLEGLRIYIQPKVPLTNLFFMLTYAYDLPEFRQEQTQIESSNDLFEFIVEIFLKQVERLVRQGIHQAYVDLEENVRFLQGRLMMAQHLRQNLVTQTRIYQECSEYTPNVLENQLLQHTLWFLARQPFSKQRLRHQVRHTYSAFNMVSPRPIQIRDFDQVHYTRLNQRYQSPINLARLLIQQLSVEGQRGAHRFFAFLFDMNQLFEQFVAQYLNQHLVHHVSMDMEIQPPLFLSTHKTTKDIPDMILRQNQQRILVMDTKYKQFKNSPKNEDRNQMVTYCHGLSLTRSLLIYANAKPVTYQDEINGIHILARSLPLHGSLTALKMRLNAFAQELQTLALPT